MKCPNCGFDCNDKFCAMCGTKMPEQPANTNRNPYAYTPDNTVNPPTDNFNQPINNPYNLPTAGGANPFGGDFQDGVPNMPQSNIPQPNAYQSSIPQPDTPQNGMPVQPAYPVPPQINNSPKKKSKALPIIAVSLIFAVIIAGTVIAIVSSCTYNKSVFADIFNSITNDESFNSYDDLYSIEDTDKHKIGEAKELADCKITLKKFEREKMSKEDSNGNSRASFVFEIENTSDIDIVLEDIYTNAYTTDKSNSLNWLADTLEDDTDGNYKLILNENEKKEVRFDYSVPNDATSVSIELGFTNYKSGYTYYGTFVAE